MEWISVDKETPKPIYENYSDRVLVVSKNGVIGIERYNDVFGWTNVLSTTEITHWMPLPIKPSNK